MTVLGKGLAYPIEPASPADLTALAAQVDAAGGADSN